MLRMNELKIIRSIKIGLMRIEGVLWWILAAQTDATHPSISAFCIVMAVVILVVSSFLPIFKPSWFTPKDK